MVKVKDTVKKLDPYVPGKSIPEIAQKYNLDPETIIKLGSNENPLGPSEKSMDAIKICGHLLSQFR